jgi:hypothetical protein
MKRQIFYHCAAAASSSFYEKKSKKKRKVKIGIHFFVKFGQEVYFMFSLSSLFFLMVSAASTGFETPTLI